MFAKQNVTRIKKKNAAAQELLKHTHACYVQRKQNKPKSFLILKG